MRRSAERSVKGWTTSSPGWAGHSDSGRLSQSRRQEVGTSLGTSWLPDWGFTGSEQGSKKPQRSNNRPGTPRPSNVEHLQSQTVARRAAKENCSREAGQSTKPSSRQALRRLQQRAALQSLDGQLRPHDDALLSSPESLPTQSDCTDGIFGHSEPSIGLQHMSLLPSTRQPGFPGRPAFEGAAPSETISASLLQPGQQASGRDGSSREAVVPKLDFSRVSSADATTEDAGIVSGGSIWGNMGSESATQPCLLVLPGVLDGAYMCMQPREAEKSTVRNSAGVSSKHTQQGIHFDTSIGLPLPGSPDSWEPFNPTFLGLGAPGFAQSPDLWGCQDRQLMPSYHLMSSIVADVVRASSANDVSSDAQHDTSTHAAAHSTVSSRGRAAGEEDVLHALDSCKLHASSITSIEPAPGTPGLDCQNGAGRSSSAGQHDMLGDVESIEHRLEVSSTSEISPQSQTSSPGAATPVRAGPSPESVNRADWSPFISHLLEDTVKGLFQSPFKREARA